MKVIVGSTNITEYVQETTYKVNREDVYEEYNDGNHVTHRVLLRTRVTGSFDLVFVDPDNIRDVLNLIKASKTNNKVPMRVWVPNINQEVNSNFYIKITSKKKRKISNKYDFNLFGVEIEEA